MKQFFSSQPAQSHSWKTVEYLEKIQQRTAIMIRDLETMTQEKWLKKMNNLRKWLTWLLAVLSYFCYRKGKTLFYMHIARTKSNLEWEKYRWNIKEKKACNYLLDTAISKEISYLIIVDSPLLDIVKNLSWITYILLIPV